MMSPSEVSREVESMLDPQAELEAASEMLDALLSGDFYERQERAVQEMRQEWQARRAKEMGTPVPSPASAVQAMRQEWQARQMGAPVPSPASARVRADSRRQMRRAMASLGCRN